jgi:hypothetical protein
VVGRAEGGSAKEEVMRDEVDSKRRRIWYQLATKTSVACSRKGATGRHWSQDNPTHGKTCITFGCSVLLFETWLCTVQSETFKLQLQIELPLKNTGVQYVSRNTIYTVLFKKI